MLFPAAGGPKLGWDKPSSPNEVIEAIQRQVEAELAKADELRRQNDLAEKTLVELERTRQSQQQRVRLAFDTHDQVTGLLTRLGQVFEDIRQIRARLAEAERRSERMDDIVLLLLTDHRPQKIAEIRDDLEAEIAERTAERKRLLSRHTRNLARLKEQAAAYGALDVPLALRNQIEAEQELVRELEEGL